MATVVLPNFVEQTDDACEGLNSTWTDGPFEGAQFEIELNSEALTVSHYNRLGEHEWDADYQRHPNSPSTHLVQPE